MGLFAHNTHGEILQVDSDFNGKMDQWHEMSDDGQTIKIEYDTNGDGKLDQVDIYDGNKKPILVKLDRNV